MAKIHCCGCDKVVKAKLTDGREIYPHRPDLSELPFWKCPTCGNFVGCHHLTKDRTKPLGCIPTPELREARKRIHAVLDPLWRCGRARRVDVYAAMSQALGYTFHASELKTMAGAERALACAKNIEQDVNAPTAKRL